nr:uncharacterized protein LOC117836750 [Setaria viridis]
MMMMLMTTGQPPSGLCLCQLLHGRIGTHKDCTIDAASIAIDNPMHRELLPRLTVDPEEVSVTFSRLLTAHPTLGLGMNGDVVVYLLSKVDYMAREGWVIAVGTKDSKLQGIAKLDDRKNFSFRRYYCSTDISKYLTKATGEAGRLVRRTRFSRQRR